MRKILPITLSLLFFILYFSQATQLVSAQETGEFIFLDEAGEQPLNQIFPLSVDPTKSITDSEIEITIKYGCPVQAKSADFYWIKSEGSSKGDRDPEAVEGPEVSGDTAVFTLKHKYSEGVYALGTTCYLDAEQTKTIEENGTYFFIDYTWKDTEDNNYTSELTVTPEIINPYESLTIYAKFNSQYDICWGISIYPILAGGGLGTPLHPPRGSLVTCTDAYDTATYDAYTKLFSLEHATKDEPIEEDFVIEDGLPQGFYRIELVQLSRIKDGGDNRNVFAIATRTIKVGTPSLNAYVKPTSQCLYGVAKDGTIINLLDKLNKTEDTEVIDLEAFKKEQEKIVKCLAVPTAFGLISTDPAGFISSVLGLLLSISGAIALIIIIRAGYEMMTSAGNPERIQEAKERITSAIVGLLFIIFSLVILQVIGVDILRIPDFIGN